MKTFSRISLCCHGDGRTTGCRLLDKKKVRRTSLLHQSRSFLPYRNPL
ncbi:hypothetical protein X975_26814, partial [Stegodyphus mimosarum]